MKKRRWISLLLAFGLVFTNVESTALAVAAAEAPIIEEEQDGFPSEQSADTSVSAQQQEVQGNSETQEETEPVVQMETSAETQAETEFWAESETSVEVQTEPDLSAETETSVETQTETEVVEQTEISASGETELTGESLDDQTEEIIMDFPADSDEIVIEEVEILDAESVKAGEAQEIAPVSSITSVQFKRLWRNTFIQGIEKQLYNCRAEMTVTYSDGTVSDIVMEHLRTAWSDDKGNTIDCILKTADGMEQPVWVLDPGSYKLEFSYNGKLFHTEPITVVSAKDESIPTLQLGKNQVESGAYTGDMKVYRFVPETTGEYCFNPIGQIELYRWNDNWGSEGRMEQVYDPIIGGRINLSAGTYYLGISEGIRQGWETLSAWEMEITRTPEVAKIHLNPDKAKIVLKPNYSIGDMLDDEYYGLYVAYKDGREEYIGLPDDGMTLTRTDGQEFDIYDNLASGTYTWKISYKGQETAVPVEVLSLASSSKGVWDLSKPLTVDNSDGYAVYQIIPSNSGKYTLNCGLGLYGNLYTESGERIEEFYGENSDTIRTTLEIGQTYYLYVKKSKQYPSYKVRAELISGAQIVEVKAHARRSEYLAQFDSVMPSDFYTEVCYSDGSVNTLYDSAYLSENVRVHYKIRSEDGIEQYQFDELAPGKYTVIPELTTWLDEEVKVNGVEIQVNSVDTSLMQQIAEGETIRAYGYQTKRFVFVPAQDGIYSIKDDGAGISVYYYNEKYAEWVYLDSEESMVMKEGGKYIVEASPDWRSKLSWEFCIVRENDIDTDFGPTSTGGILETGFSDVVIAEQGDTISYTFTPERTGNYKLYTQKYNDSAEFAGDIYIGQARPEAYLYQGDIELAHSGGNEEDFGFELGYRLKAGVTYTYKVGLQDKDAVGYFRMHMISSSIATVEIQEEDEKKEYGAPDFSSMWIKLIYLDGTNEWVSFPDVQSESVTDEFGNEIQYDYGIYKETPGNWIYDVQVRYREFGMQEWTVVSKQIPCKNFKEEAEDRLLGNLKIGVVQEGGKGGYYRIVVDESGKYKAELQSTGKNVSCDGFYDIDGNRVYTNYLYIGKIYYVKIDVSDVEDVSYTISLKKDEKEIVDIEIIEKPEYIYRIIEQPYLYDDTDSISSKFKVKVTYVDGSSAVSIQTDEGLSVLPDGRSVYFEYLQVDDDTMKVTASVKEDNCKGITYVPLKEPSDAPLMQRVGSGYDYHKDITINNFEHKYVLCVMPEKTGLYQISLNGVLPEQQYFVYADILNDILYPITTGTTAIWEMEAGREYYVVIQNMNHTPLSTNVYLKYQGVSSHVCEWKEDTVLILPTCETDGLCEERCSICDSVRERKIPALGHQFTEGWQSVEPTCTTDGYERQVCDRCGKMVVRNYVGALGHDFSGAWNTDTQAGEGKEGSRHKYCARGCGEKIIEVIPALPITEVVSKVEEINASVEQIELPQEGGALTDNDIIAVDEAVKALTDIGSETLLNNVPDVVDTMEKLEGLAVAADDKLADTIVSTDAASDVALSKITGASITAAVLAKDKEIQGGLAEGELLGARVQVERSAQEDAYESLGKTTVAVDISLDLVKQNTDGAVIGIVKENVTLKVPMQVTLNVPQSFADKEFALYHITAGGNVKISYTRNEDGTITFTTPSLSDFVFALTDCGEGNHGETKITVTIDPTCSQPGRQEEICQACGKAVGEPTAIQPIAHSYIVEESRIEPDCKDGKDGSIVWKCKWCTQTRTETIPAAHEWKVIKTVSPTCAQEGYTVRKCVKCSTEEKINKVPATGKHTLTVKVDKQATCGVAGSQHKECTVCGHKEAATVVPATGKHSFGAYKETKEATALSEGTQTRSCTVCGMSESKATAKLQATISVNTKKVLLKTKQKTSAFAVSGMAKGDYVKSIVSDKDSVVKVSGVTSDGHCKLKAGKKKGSAKLTITLASGLTKIVKVKVQTAAVQTTTIKEVPKKLNLKVKESITLSPVLSPITSTDKIKYSTSDKKVVTVTSKGVVKGKKKGKAKITITAGKKKIVCTVIVKK